MRRYSIADLIAVLQIFELVTGQVLFPWSSLHTDEQEIQYITDCIGPLLLDYRESG